MSITTSKPPVNGSKNPATISPVDWFFLIIGFLFKISTLCDTSLLVANILLSPFNPLQYRISTFVCPWKQHQTSPALGSFQVHILIILNVPSHLSMLILLSDLAILYGIQTRVRIPVCCQGALAACQKIKANLWLVSFPVTFSLSWYRRRNIISIYYVNFLTVPHRQTCLWIKHCNIPIFIYVFLNSSTCIFINQCLFSKLCKFT